MLCCYRLTAVLCAPHNMVCKVNVCHNYIVFGAALQADVVCSFPIRGRCPRLRSLALSAAFQADGSSPRMCGALLLGICLLGLDSLDDYI